MNHIIKIDDESYEFVRKNNPIGEQVLRRLLHLPPFDESCTSAGEDEKALDSSEDLELLQFLKSRQFEASRDATRRFLQILAFAHRQKPTIFDKVLSIPSGRKRVKFARSKGEIEQSGTSTHPRQIPGSSFWVLTNLANGDKKELLIEALLLLGYASQVAEEAGRRI